MSGTYTIPVSGLKEGRHTIDFEIGKEFFDRFEESEVKEGSLTANIEIDKISSHIDLSVGIKGSVMVPCDRCLDMFPQQILSENRLLIKFGKSIEVDDPDIISLSSDEYELDLQQHIYEFILLALPIKRVHPDDRNGKNTCNPVMIKKLKELIINEESENDPRWDELKKILNNN
jgi:uncharacterized protein